MKNLTNLTNFQFVALDISSKIYVLWILDIEIHLDVMSFGYIIKEGNTTSLQDPTKVMIFI